MADRVSNRGSGWVRPLKACILRIKICSTYWYVRMYIFQKIVTLLNQENVGEKRFSKHHILPPLLESLNNNGMADA